MQTKFEFPQLGSCKYSCAYMNLVLGKSVFSTFKLWGFFSFFYILFFTRTKSTKTQISELVTCRPLDVFKHIFFCSLVAFCAFAWLRLCAFVFLVLLVRAKSFCKKKTKQQKNKEIKTALIITFTLLLTNWLKNNSNTHIGQYLTK